jgi:myotubularin-related protein 6/7/8
MAPVFTQFLDAIWQLTQQFPQYMEFNERYLLTIHDHVHSCQFGTFIGNCEKDRKDLRFGFVSFYFVSFCFLRVNYFFSLFFWIMNFYFFRVAERTYSLWAFLSSHRSEYINPLFDRKITDKVMDVNVSPQIIRFEDWIHLKELFFFQT